MPTVALRRSFEPSRLRRCPTAVAWLADQLRWTRGSVRRFPEPCHAMYIPAMASGRSAVLIHGGRQGGWSWVRVAPLLRSAGWEVYAPTLSGLADRAHLL